MKLLDPQFLAKGTKRQLAAFHALETLDIFSVLKDFSPVVAGSVPLDVDLPGSDLDIICFSENLEAFADTVTRRFGGFENFDLKHTVKYGLPTVIARFSGPNDFPIEIFAQGQSVFRQAAVIHLLVEARLLAFAAQGARERIRQLKGAGRSTEEAFADCFALPGEPYEELLKIAALSDREILHIAHRFLFSPQ